MTAARGIEHPSFGPEEMSAWMEAHCVWYGKGWLCGPNIRDRTYPKLPPGLIVVKLKEEVDA